MVFFVKYVLYCNILKFFIPQQFDNVESSNQTVVF